MATNECICEKLSYRRETAQRAPFRGEESRPLPSTSLSRVVVVVVVAVRAMRPLRALRSVACVNVALLHRPRGLPAN